MAGLSHFDPDGHAHMVDVSDKTVTARLAKATGWVKMNQHTLDIVQSGTADKGDVLGVARLAGIMGAKRTADLVPLCHPLPLSKVTVEMTADLDLPGIRITSTAKTTGQTGVEMEALTAVSIAGLTLYDMLKAVQRDMVIGDIRLAMKDGGRSGRFEADR